MSEHTQNTKRKKVLFVITKSVWGGAQRYVFDLATNLPREQFETAVAVGGDGPLKEKLSVCNMPVHTITGFQKSINPLKDVRAFFELLSVYRQVNPDIIHTNSSKASGIASFAAYIYRVTTGRRIQRVCTVHGWAFLETWRPVWQRFFIRILSIVTARLHDTIIVISEYDHKAALSYNVASASKVTFIHNGVGAETFLTRQEAQQDLFGTTYPLVIGSIAEWTKNKGLEYLIAAMPAVLETYPEAKLCLVGWGEDHLKLETCILKLDLKNSVFLVSKSPAAPYLKAFDVFVLPSLKEGLPYVLLEAGLAEVPMVASSVGGIPEIIKNTATGILVPPQSPEEIAKAVVALLKNKNLCQKITLSMKEHIQKNFSLGVMVQDTLRVYSSIVNYETRK